MKPQEEAGAVGTLLDEGDQAVPVDLPLCVHPPKHEQQMDKGVLSTALTRALLQGLSSVTCWGVPCVPVCPSLPGNDTHGVVQPPAGQGRFKLQECPLLPSCVILVHSIQCPIWTYSTKNVQVLLEHCRGVGCPSSRDVPSGWDLHPSHVICIDAEQVIVKNIPS